MYITVHRPLQVECRCATFHTNYIQVEITFFVCLSGYRAPSKFVADTLGVATHTLATRVSGEVRGTRRVHGGYRTGRCMSAGKFFILLC